MAQVRIARSAEADLLEGYAFYERQQAGVGEYFLDSLYADIDALAMYAGIHPKPGGRLHRSLQRARRSGVSVRLTELLALWLGIERFHEFDEFMDVVRVRAAYNDLTHRPGTYRFD